MNERKQSRRKEPTVYFSHDPDGTRIAHVECTAPGGAVTAEMAAEDFERIEAAGWSGCWSNASDGKGNRYVMVNGRRPHGGTRAQTVARLVLDAPSGKRVGYLDRNRLNLRRSNLYISNGAASADAAALCPRAGFPPMSSESANASAAAGAPS